MRSSKWILKAVCSTSFIASVAFADAPAPRDVLANLAGCYDVVYRFVEDGPHDLTIAGSYELIEARPATLQGAVVSLQHYGILDGQKFKHWSEEWVPTNEATGEWTQTVFSPTNRVRYECKGQFNFHQFRCHAEKTPIPQRDIDRTDYETIDRDQTLQITAKTFIQSELNLKRDANGKPVATEVGWIEYKKVDAAHCAPTPR